MPTRSHSALHGQRVSTPEGPSLSTLRCICAWAFAAAVKRDPSRREGITLECDRTNAKLREVYEMHIQSGADLTSPSGASYKARAALDAVDQLCPAPASAVAATTTAAAASVAATSLRTASRPSSDGSAHRSPTHHWLSLVAAAVICVTAALGAYHAYFAYFAGRHRRQLVGGSYGSPLPSADLGVRGVKDLRSLGCYDSGGESEHAERAGERLRVRETPPMRDAV